MSTLDAANLPSESAARPSSSPDGLNDRLAEAACYAVLCRLMPALRHGVAGTLQPVRMLMMVLERRVNELEPDMQAITKSVMSASALTKQATAACINAVEWMGSSQDTHVNLHSSVDEAVKLLAIELSTNGLELVNGISDDAATASQRFLRTVFMGGLLAFCDQSAAGGILHVTFEAATDSPSASQLQVRLLPSDAGKSTAFEGIVGTNRLIDWADVEAMAVSFNVSAARGDGWLTLDLPKD